jgi:glycosidase
MVCESPGDPAGFARESACGSAFAFGHSDELVKAGRGDEAAIRRVADYFLAAPAGMATMVSNHDAFAGRRLWDALDGDAARVRVAAAAYLLQPGTPYLYYGEELGMSHAQEDDRDAQLRGPMSWTPAGGFTTGTPFRRHSTNLATHNAQAEAADPGSMLAFYTAMLRLRNTHPSIALGRYLAPRVDGRVMSFQRALGDERTLVVINYGDAAGAARVPGWAPNQALQRLYPPAGGAADARPAPGRDDDAVLVPAHEGDAALVPAPGLSVQVFRVAG